MSNPKGVAHANNHKSVQYTNLVSPRSPVNLEDYSNIRRPSPPPQQQHLQPQHLQPPKQQHLQPQPQHLQPQQQHLQQQHLQPPQQQHLQPPQQQHLQPQQQHLQQQHLQPPQQQHLQPQQEHLQQPQQQHLQPQQQHLQQQHLQPQQQHLQPQQQHLQPQQQHLQPQQQHLQQQQQQGSNKKADTSSGKSPFQRELEDALVERKKRGLVTGFSDSEKSERRSEKSEEEEVEISNKNITCSGYPQEAEQNSSGYSQNNEHLQHNEHRDSILYNSNDENDCARSQERCADKDTPQYAACNNLQHSLQDSEQVEAVMNQHSQSSNGFGDVLDEDDSANGSRSYSLRDSDVSNGSGLDGDILQLDDTEGSGLMDEKELHEQRLLFIEQSRNNFHGNSSQIPDQNADLVMRMYTEASPRSPTHLEEEDFMDDENGDSEDDYVDALRKASVDDIADVVAEGNMTAGDDDDCSHLEYSDQAFQKEDHLSDGHNQMRNREIMHQLSNVVDPMSNDYQSYHDHQEYDMHSSTSRQSLLDDLFSGEISESSEDSSPELGNTVVEVGNLNAAIYPVSSKVESFVDEPEMESDATSVSLGQFVPNAVKRTRLLPPGQRRARLHSLRKLRTDLSVDKPNSLSASKKLSPRTTPRRLKPNSPRNIGCASSPRASGNINSKYSDKSQSRSSSEDYLAMFNHCESSPSDPTGLSLYVNSRNDTHNYQRPEGVPPLDFGNSINSNVSFVPRDDSKEQSQMEEFAIQLQKEYDNLLTKYAQAENTIDQLRLGAKVNLYGDDPVPLHATQHSFIASKQPQVLHFGQAQKASMHHVISKSAVDGNQVASVPSTAHVSIQTPVEKDTYSFRNGADDRELSFPAEVSAGGKSMALMFQAKDLEGKIDTLETLLKEQLLPPTEQKTAYNHLKIAQEKLESDYMQAKEEANALRRCNSMLNNGNEDVFDPDRAMEGQIFRLGMTLDDIHGTVMENARNQPVVLDTASSIQEMYPSKINDRKQEKCGNNDCKQGKSGPQAQSRIPVLRRSEPQSPGDHIVDVDNAGNEDSISDVGEDEHVEEIDDSASTPLSPPSDNSFPSPTGPYNGRYGRRQDRHRQPSLVSSSPEFHKKQQTKKGQDRKPSLVSANSKHPSPRTGSSDHLDVDGARQKSPEMDFDSGFMGSESSRQSNQMRSPGYKQQPGLVSTSTKTKSNRQDSQIPQRQISQTFPKSNHLGSTATSWGSLQHSESVRVSESDEEQVMQKPARRHSRGGNAPRQSGLRKTTSTLREPHRKHTQKILSHAPPHQSIPPCSKRHQRHSQAAVPAHQLQEMWDPSRTEPPSRQLREPHQYPGEKQSYHSNSDSNDGIITPSMEASSAAKPSSVKSHDVMVSNGTTHSTCSRPQGRPTRTKKYRHRTPHSDSGSDITRSSVKSEVVRALHKQIEDLKRQLNDKNEPQQWFHEKPPSLKSSGRPRDIEEVGYGMSHDSRNSDAGSRHSEALQTLREELDEIKEHLRQKESSAPTCKDYRPTLDRTLMGEDLPPVSDSLRDTLRSQYIPQSSPVRTSQPQKHTYRPQKDHKSPYRTSLPPRLHLSDLDMLPPPQLLKTSHAGRSIPFLTTHTELCRLCGGTGTHTHRQYQLAGDFLGAVSQPPPQPTTYAQTPPLGFTYARSTPSGLSYAQTPPSGFPYAEAPPVITSTPVVNLVTEAMPYQSYAAPPMTQSGKEQPYKVPSRTCTAYATTGPSQPSVHVREDATPEIYLTTSRRKGRYYTREEESSLSSNDDGDVELYYRRSASRTPRAASRTPRSVRPSRNISVLRKTLHSELAYDENSLDRSLDTAVNMAHKLKRASKRMLTSVRKDASCSDSLQETSFY